MGKQRKSEGSEDRPQPRRRPADMYRDMGERIRDAWEAQAYAVDAFPEIARKTLDDPILYQIGQDDWMHEPWPTAQRMLYAHKHKNPKRLFQIEARLYTPESPVAIADEAFIGASRMMIGVVIENRFAFEITDAHPAPRCRVGALTQQSARLLRHVDSPESSDGTPYIDSIVLIDPRAIRMIIRTPWQLPERWRYYPPGLATLEPTTLADVERTPAVSEAADRAVELAGRLDALRRVASTLTNRDLKLLVTLLATQFERQFVVDLIMRRTGGGDWQGRLVPWLRELSTSGKLRLAPESIDRAFIDHWLKLDEKQAVASWRDLF